jgi:oligoendopeptidase F
MSQTTDFLPSWDLTDFYADIKDPQIEKDIDHARQLVHSFTTTYSGKLVDSSTFSGPLLYQALQDYEKIEELLGKIISFGFLCFATQAHVPSIVQFFQKTQETVTTLSSPLIFFTLDLNKIPDENLGSAYETTPSLGRYKTWIDNIRQFRPYQLSADLEKLLHEKSISGRNAWCRLFEETLASMKLDLEGKSYTVAEVLNHLSHKEAPIRAAAAQSLSDGLTKQLSLFAMITNTLAKDKEIEDTWRGYPHPVAARNLANHVEDEVVEALVTTVKKNYASLSHRYYALKATWMGVDKIEYWDRNAPLPDADDRYIKWEEAKKIVHDAYAEFCPALADIGSRFFKNNWIDVGPKEGKESGAFAHPTIPSLHPYILLNYQGKLRDVMTLAHELGHGIHQVLAAPQGPLLSDTPLTIAETASVFGEMLTFKALLRKVNSIAQKRQLIAAKVEDMINTVVRQIAFYDFEYQVHMRRRNHELTPEELGDIWIQTQKEALGEAVNLDNRIRPYWAYISHFVRAPFYVYAYAFGDCLVNSLYSAYEKGDPKFVERYIELLQAGGSKRHGDLLAPFGLNAKDPAFWQGGLDVIIHLIDELESLEGTA